MCLCLCEAVTVGWRRSEAASCSMVQRTFFAVSSNSFCLLLAPFAVLFLALSLSCFTNSLRVNSSNCFLTERKAQPDECFLCYSIGSSSGSQPSNSLKQKKHWARSGSFSVGQWAKPAAAICKGEPGSGPSAEGFPRDPGAHRGLHCILVSLQRRMAWQISHIYYLYEFFWA